MLVDQLTNQIFSQIFMLNARLAAAESMTHDVIRDLLGLKLDMNSCAVICSLSLSFLQMNCFRCNSHVQH